MHIGEKVKHMREIRDLSMRQLAERIGRHVSLISRIEGGETQNPSFEDISRIAHALGVEIAFFQDETARTPLQVTDELPEHLREFVLNSKSIPYLHLAKEALDKELDPASIRALIDALQYAYNRKDNPKDSDS